MNSGQGAVFAVREEHAMFGGVAVAKKTMIAATDEGLVYGVTLIL